MKEVHIEREGDPIWSLYVPDNTKLVELTPSPNDPRETVVSKIEFYSEKEDGKHIC